MLTDWDSSRKQKRLSFMKTFLNCGRFCYLFAFTPSHSSFKFFQSNIFWPFLLRFTRASPMHHNLLMGKRRAVAELWDECGMKKGSQQPWKHDDLRSKMQIKILMIHHHKNQSNAMKSWEEAEAIDEKWQIPFDKIFQYTFFICGDASLTRI